MVEWLNTNQGAVQGMAAIAISLLTAVLVVVTIHYARANWRVAELMEKDLRFKVEPRLSFSVDKYDSVSRGPDQIKVHISVENGPAIITKLHLTLGKRNGKEETEEIPFVVGPEGVIPSYPFRTSYKLKGYDWWSVTVSYSDALRLFETTDTIKSDLRQAHNS